MHVAIVKLSALGDVVHAMPSAAALRREITGVRITWIVEKGAATILRGSPAIDRLIELDTHRWRRQLLKRNTQRELAARLSSLRSEPIDVALDMQGLLKSGLVAFATGARRRIGFATDALREPASRAFLTEQVAVDDRGHVIEKNLALVRQLGVDAGGAYEFPIAVPEESELAAATRAGGDPFAILNPGGGWWTKLWPAERYGQLADRIYEQHGLRSLVTFGPGEETLAREVASASSGGHAQPFPCTLLEFVALCRRARLVVSGDTGPMHLAAAVSAPIVGIFGPTSPLRNGPFDPRDRTVGRSDLPCRTDCYRRTCDHWECMEISVESVQRVVDARLQTR
jgi:lipopolysaccharide heptosyltransferase I